MRRQIHAAPAVEGRAFDSVPRVQEAGAQGPLYLSFADEAEAAFGFRRQEGGLQGPEAGRQRRVRAAVSLESGWVGGDGRRTGAHIFRNVWRVRRSKHSEVESCDQETGSEPAAKMPRTCRLDALRSRPFFAPDPAVSVPQVSRPGSELFRSGWRNFSLAKPLHLLHVKAES